MEYLVHFFPSKSIHRHQFLSRINTAFYCAFTKKKKVVSCITLLTTILFHFSRIIILFHFNRLIIFLLYQPGLVIINQGFIFCMELCAYINTTLKQTTRGKGDLFFEERGKENCKIFLLKILPSNIC